MQLNGKKLLGISLDSLSKNDVLEKIKKDMVSNREFYHVVSLNPEILVIASKDSEFKKVVLAAQIRIVDGIGIVLAARLKRIRIGSRLTGVDLMKALMEEAGKNRFRVLLIGGKANLANSLAECYQRRFPEAKFLGVEGIKDVKNPTPQENKALFSIVAGYKPHFVFAAFGSPDQELWFYRNREHLKGTICMGVGGAFDFLGGGIRRAPPWVRSAGLEWLYRLFVQPWRWRRQLRLFEFVRMVLSD